MASSSTFVYADHSMYVWDDSHVQSSAECLLQLWESQQLCDVELLVEDLQRGQIVSCVSAHRAVLAASVPYFRELFCGGGGGSEPEAEATQGPGGKAIEDQEEVILKDVKVDILKKMIRFAYSSRIEVAESDVREVLVAATLLGFSNLAAACVGFMHAHLSPSNCLETWHFAHTRPMPDLEAASFRYALQNFSRMCLDRNFLLLPVEKVEALVSNNAVRVDAEEEVYEAVTRWIEEDVQSRAEEAERLYEHVRFPVISPEYLNGAASKNAILCSTDLGSLMLQEAQDYHQNPSTVFSFANPEKTQPRRSAEGVICLVGGTGEDDKPLNTVSFFSPHEKQWRQGTGMPSSRSHLAVAILKGELYAIGGTAGAGEGGGESVGGESVVCGAVERYSPKTDSWRNVAPLNVPRSGCAAVVVGRRICVLGGYSGDVYLHSTELYDPEDDEWVHQPAMLEARSNLSAVYFDQRIYAIGGVNQTARLSSVERFDIVNRRWECVVDMCVPRAACG